MAATGNQAMWAFLHYARGNPFNSLNSVHWDEIYAMAKIFARVNESDLNTGTETDPAASYGSEIDIPGLLTANDDTFGISWTTPTQAKIDRARYPESHTYVNPGTPIGV